MLPFIFSSGVPLTIATSPLACTRLSGAGRLADASARPFASASKLLRGAAIVPVTTPLALIAPSRSLLTADNWRASTFHCSFSPGAPKLPLASMVFCASVRCASTPLMCSASARSLPLPVSGWPNNLLALIWKPAATCHAGAMAPSALTSAFRSAIG